MKLFRTKGSARRNAVKILTREFDLDQGTSELLARTLKDNYGEPSYEFILDDPISARFRLSFFGPALGGQPYVSFRPVSEPGDEQGYKRAKHCTRLIQEVWK